MGQRADDRSWVSEFYDAAAEWWGYSWYEGRNLQPRLEKVQRFAGAAPRSLLELGAGTGETAAYLATAGYTVTAVDISEKNYALLKEVATRCPAVTPLHGDFQTVAIPGRFDAVCMFETFGMGDDADQRHLLRRIVAEWLDPGGVVILDVYHPFGPIRQAGTAQALERLENVTGSVAMTERSYYDAVLGRWIDEWEPISDHTAMRRQSVRCYTPADLRLLLEGTGLEITHAEFAGRDFDSHPAEIATDSPLQDFESDYAYTVVLRAEAAM